MSGLAPPRRGVMRPTGCRPFRAKVGTYSSAFMVRCSHGLTRHGGLVNLKWFSRTTLQLTADRNGFLCAKECGGEDEHHIQTTEDKYCHSGDLGHVGRCRIRP